MARGPRARERGGKGGAEPRARILTRRARAWQRSLQGASQREIAAELGVSQPAVSKMLRRVARDVIDDLRHQTTVQQARQVHRLELVVTEALAAWEQSKRERTQRRQRRQDAPGGPAGGRLTVSEAVVTSRDGDPRYLRQALTALADLRTVTGLDARDTAEPVAATTSAAWDLRKLTTEELQQLETMAEKACARPAD